MGNLLDPLTGTIHATAVDGTRRALCDLAVTVPGWPDPNGWLSIHYSRVTCSWCRLRIDRAEAEAHGDYDSSGHLDIRVVDVANAIRGEVEKAGNDIYATTSFVDLASLLAEKFFPGDEERQIHFCHWALDPEYLR